MKRAASLFQNGAILGKTYQAYDSHVPYILKFFIDYNLYGMSFLHIPEYTIRDRCKSNYNQVDLLLILFILISNSNHVCQNPQIKFIVKEFYQC